MSSQAAAPAATTVAPHNEVSPRARQVTLFLLTATYFFSYMDRQILAILLEDIKADLLLTDTQLGLLSGFAFAIFYATLGIPVAALADRMNRVNIISIALALWSAMTAACGLANNFIQLLAARIGVGIGEAGSSPPSHSIIADLYPAEKRALALSIYSLGVTLGAAAGQIFGGNLTYFFDWRTAFIAIGLPGVALAIIVKIFATEPMRRAEPGAVESDETPSVWEGFRTIFANRAAVWLVAGVTLTSMIGYALTGWTPAYLIRSFGLNTLQVGNIVAPLLAIAGVASGLGSGWLANRLSERYGMQAQPLMVAALKTIALPFLILFYVVESAWLAVGIYFIAVLFQSCYLGPTFAMIQTLAPLKMRAVWAAVTLLIINLIGLGIGPTMVGVLSDIFAESYGDQSLRQALLVIASFTPVAIFCYWRASVALRRMAAEKAAAEAGSA
ncbi:Predicted arabinose efflux permease, MFS family [Altererythrobacter xiamenensis]|uniref:Predicted arabinose efflux permease, MFS family n=1 Tax=Altererythrobacter xiamenensis TaxID=1316679 RepID=A0A1Y6ENE0_9SPHN|nr:MFS transporter [Altererythrobacter xiamenensis]SMQ63819.1 Predicted arabinose efflux permease, MFS family [Altererythrobacter xiamenensis]